MHATVYSTSKCVWCDRTISLLKDHNVKVTKVPVDVTYTHLTLPTTPNV